MVQESEFSSRGLAICVLHPGVTFLSPSTVHAFLSHITHIDGFILGHTNIHSLYLIFSSASNHFIFIHF